MRRVVHLSMGLKPAGAAIYMPHEIRLLNDEVNIHRFLNTYRARETVPVVPQQLPELHQLFR